MPHVSLRKSPPRPSGYWMTTLALLWINMISLAIADNLKIELLTGVHRLNSTAYTDYYICCNVIGRFLRWQVNGDSLTGFQFSDTGLVRVLERPTFEYTATLLSSQPDPDDDTLYHMDSVIVVSFTGEPPSTVLVTCASTTNTSTITVSNTRGVVEGTDTSGNDQVVFNYVLSRPIVHNLNYTHIFICGAQDVQQYYQLGGSRIGFGSHDNIGQAKLVFSENGNVVTILGILIARQPYMSTSILFVSENSNVNVVCFDGTDETELSSCRIAPTTLSPTPSPSPCDHTASLSSNHMSSQREDTVTSLSSSLPVSTMTMKMMDVASSETTHTIGTIETISSIKTVIAVIVAVAVIIIVLLFIIVALVCHRHCRVKHQYSPEDSKKTVKPSQEEGRHSIGIKDLMTGTSIGCSVFCSSLRDISPSSSGVPNDRNDSDKESTEIQPVLQQFISPLYCSNEQVEYEMTSPAVFHSDKMEGADNCCVLKQGSYSNSGARCGIYNMMEDLPYFQEKCGIQIMQVLGHFVVLSFLVAYTSWQVC